MLVPGDLRVDPMAGREFSWAAVMAVGVVEFVAVTGTVAMVDLGESFDAIVVATMAGYAVAILGMATAAAMVYR